jgi:hypothetical protein
LGLSSCSGKPPHSAHFACCTKTAWLAILPPMGGAGGEGKEAGALSRRQFAQASVRVGLGATAAIWVAPQLSSLPLARGTAGSPPPSDIPDEEPQDTGEPDADLASRAPGRDPHGAEGTGAPNAGAQGAEGELPLTGADVRKLAATGGAAVLTGSALVAAERLSERGRPRPATAAEGSGGETGR